MARHRSLSKNLPETQPSSSHLVADPAAKYKKLPKKSPGISIFLMLPLLFKILVFLGIFIYGLFQLYAGNINKSLLCCFIKSIFQRGPSFVDNGKRRPTLKCGILVKTRNFSESEE